MHTNGGRRAAKIKIKYEDVKCARISTPTNLKLNKYFKNSRAGARRRTNTSENKEINGAAANAEDAIWLGCHGHGPIQ